VLGFFIDFFEIAFILLPLLAPVAAKLGIDPVWFGVMIAMNLQTSFLTPPFGFALFYLKSVAPPQIRTTDIYRGVLPFIGVQLIALTMVIAWPQLVNVLRDAPVAVPANIEIELPGGETAPADSQTASDIERLLRENK